MLEKHKNTTIVLVNWNNSEETIKCLNSIRNMKKQFVHVVVVDNGSTDSSIVYMREYIKTNYSEYKSKKFFEYKVLEGRNNDILVSIIISSENFGFAAGCNIGMQYAMELKSHYVWLLNNDTIVERDALENLIIKSIESGDQKIIGSWVKFYSNQNETQVYGGARYNKWWASIHDIKTVEDYGAGIDYIYGASMFIPINIVEKIGLLEEKLFLYGEEIDYCYRAKKYGIKLDIANKSIIYHKHGSSIGSNNNLKKRTNMSDFYSLRNKVFIAKKFYPLSIITIGLRLIISMMIRIRYQEFVKMKICWYCIKLIFTNEYLTYEEWYNAYIR